MRTKLSIYNTLTAMLLQFVNLIVNFILPKVLIPEYGSATNGLVLSIRLIISYFSVVEGGLSLAATFALYKPLADKDDRKINSILSAANKFYNISGFLFSALVLVLTFFYTFFKSGEGFNPLVVAVLVLSIGAAGALDYFAIGKYKVLLTADQKSYAISLINALAIAVNAVIIVVLAEMHVNIALVQVFALSSFLLRSVVYSLYARYKYHYLNLKAEPDVRALDKRWDSLFLNTLGAVTMGTPVLVITIFCGFKEVSVYNNYNIVFGGVLAILSTFNNGLSASFGDMLARKETDIFQRAYKQYEYMYYLLLGWAYSCAAILVMSFMKIYTREFTDANYIRPEIAALLVATGLLFNTKTPQGMLVISAGLYKETKYQTLAQALINIIVSVALAPFLGVAGVLIGSVASNLYRTIDLAFFIPRALTKLPPGITIRRLFRLVILFGISVFPVLKWVNLNRPGYLGWLVTAVAAATWCFMVFAIGNIIAERATAKAIFQRFSYMLRKKA